MLKQSKATSGPDGATGLEEIRQRLNTQVAIYARDFGALLGMSPAETTEAISKKRLGVPTFQVVENGMHRVSSDVVRQFCAEKGIEL